MSISSTMTAHFSGAPDPSAAPLPDHAHEATAAPERVGLAPTAGRPANPWLVRGSLTLLLLATGALYLIGLGESGYANSFYSAAAQAGSQSWKAWFFASLDAGNAITVDKPPASLWLMGLSVRIFGLSSWSILVPEALLGVASVGVLYATLRRALTHRLPGTKHVPTTQLAHWAALAGAFSLAVTPVVTLMFRFNNPDALLVCCELVAAYFVIRATETASRKHLVFAGIAIGLGFLTKTLQVFLVLPGFVIAYAVAAPATWRKKIVDLLAALASMVVAAGWCVALFELVPNSWRPYMGGSQTNSLLELTFGYNGVGRITGDETGSVGGGGFGDSTGLTRMFTGVQGGMSSWLVPAAFVLAIFTWVVLGRRAWANTIRPGVANLATQANSALLVFGGWMVVTAVVFSFMSGIFHDYYTIALAPGIAGSVGIAAAVLWAHRDRFVARVGLAVASAVTGCWAVTLLAKAGGWYLGLGVAALVASIIAGLGLLFADKLPTKLTPAALALAFVAASAGPTAYAVNTAQTPHTGSIVTAGPVSSGMGGGNRGGGMGGGRGGMQPPRGTTQNGNTQNGTTQNGTTPNGTSQNGTSQTGTSQPDGRTGGAGGSTGGLLNGATVSDEMKQLLLADAGSYTWVAATVGAQNAASYQLATEESVIALGGFNGSDPAPTLEQFKEWVAQGKVHYFIGGGSFGQQNGGASDASEIATWVQENFTAQTVGSTTVYDLTQS